MNKKLLLSVLGSLIVGICLGWILSPSSAPEYNGVGVPYAEEYDAYIRQHGFNTNLPASFGSSTTMTGTLTQTGTSTLATTTLGTNGTAINRKNAGFCTIWADATTIAATSSKIVTCQSATNGSLTSGLTGVSYGDIVRVGQGTSTSATVGGLLINGATASSTAGSIDLRIYNATGATFTWTAAASSSSATNPNWVYEVVDIN